jgi:DNA primase
VQSGAGTNDDIARVLASTDIVRLIGDHVAVKKKGREFVCICPFHDDHSPSMTIAPSKGIYKCFACGAGGDAIKFVREYHKLSFRESLQFLADRAGITLTPWRPTHTGPGFTTGDDAETASREDLRSANRCACDFFQVLLRHPEHGQLARSVIEKRQVSPEMVARFQLGASPDMWDGLLKLIQSKKLEIKPFLGASLVRAREGGNSYFDFFRNRLMFPIHDQAGYVIGFGARKLREEDEPKYLNSPETILFNKSETLYGIHQAADTIRKSEQAILVEGYMDVIACHQAGLTNAVAALGTSLTAQGATRLARQCNSVVLLFDGDEAGAKAADRAVEVFFASPMDVKIATLTAARARGEITAKDPDELLKQPGGADKLRAIIAQASDALEYRMARLRQRLSAMSGTAKSQAVEEELKRLAELGLSRIAPIRREMVLKQIAVALGVSESLVRASVPFGRELGPARRVQPIELARAEPLRLALKSCWRVRYPSRPCCVRSCPSRPMFFRPIGSSIHRSSPPPPQSSRSLETRRRIVLVCRPRCTKSKENPPRPNSSRRSNSAPGAIPRPCSATGPKPWPSPPRNSPSPAPAHRATLTKSARPSSRSNTPAPRSLSSC